MDQFIQKFHSGWAYIALLLLIVAVVNALIGLLSKKEFIPWLKKFAPKLFNKNFNIEVAKVSDRTDGHLVHLDGLNFSRAWNLYYLLNQYPKEFLHLKKVADYHFNFSLPSIVDGNYEGEHWLASFALRTFEEKK